MNVAVVGIGRIGLPVAAFVASRGHHVFGCDIDAARVAMVNRGEDPIGYEVGLPELLRQVVDSRSLEATTDTAAAVRDSRVILFAVAVDVDGEGRADLAGLLKAAEAVGQSAQPGALCIFDTTLPIGTTRRSLAPRLESGGLKLGKDLFVAFSPERILMGRVLEDLVKYPKVVGGLDAESGRRAAEFYRSTFGIEVIELANAETAEMSKLAEGAYRDLNIALANQLATIADAHRIDVSEVIRTANTQPYSNIHTPGTGVGGHCIPVYPRFLMQGEGTSSLSALGRELNDSMPGYAVARVESEIGSLAGKRVLVMGLTFRPDVAVTPHTNAVDLLREFTARGAVVRGHDPLLSEAGVRALGFEPAVEPLAEYDVVAIHAYHAAYRGLDWRAIAPVVLDCRNAMERGAVEAKGAVYVGIGRPITGR